MSINSNSSWPLDPLVQELIGHLTSGKLVDTREFLKPIYRWMKNGSRSFDLDKTFSFAEWVVCLALFGDDNLGISKQAHLQPKYVYNTIITMSQRNNCLESALRAYYEIGRHNFDPDVFTMTALIDIVGRNGQYNVVAEIYGKMIQSHNCLPNVVTFVTMIRLYQTFEVTADFAKEEIMRLLRDAHSMAEQRSNSTGTSSSPYSAQIINNGYKVDLSIYNACLVAFVRLKDIDYFRKILNIMQEEQVELNSNTYDIISKMFIKQFYIELPLNNSIMESINNYLYFIFESNDHSSISNLNIHILSYVEKKLSDNISGNTCKTSYAGCLGPDAPSTMRVSVVQHDLIKLVERVTIPSGNVSTLTSTSYHTSASSDFSSCVTESDFVTLLHQCRKRKWPDQIRPILEFQERIGTIGSPLLCLTALPHLRPTCLSFECAFEGYFNMNCVEDASSLFNYLFVDHGDNCDISYFEKLQADITIEFFTLLVEGFIHCNSVVNAMTVYRHIRINTDIIPNFELVKSMMRGLGGHYVEGLYVIEDWVSVFFMEQNSDTSLLREALAVLCITLLESIAALGQHLITFCDCVDALLSSSSLSIRTTASAVLRNENSSFVHTCLMLLCNNHDIIESYKGLTELQRKLYIPRFKIFYSIITEAIFGASKLKSQRVMSQELLTLPFRGFARVGAFQNIYQKKVIVNYICEQLIKGHQISLDFEDTLLFVKQNVENDEICLSYISCFSSEQNNRNYVHTTKELVHYLKEYSAASIPIVRKNISIVCFLQCLYTYMCTVRSKQEKSSFVSAISGALSIILLSNEKGIFADILCRCIRLIYLFNFSIKQQSKVFSVLVDCIRDCPTVSSEGNVCVSDYYSEPSDKFKILLAIQEGPDLSLGILKECHKLLKLETSNDDKLYDALWHCLCRFAFNDATNIESQIQVLQYIKQYAVFERLLSKHEDIESSLVRAFLRDNTKNVGAIIFYLGLYNEYAQDKVAYNDGCIRVVRLLIECGCQYYTTAAKLLCKFNIMNLSEFQFLLNPDTHSLVDRIPRQCPITSEKNVWTAESIDYLLVNSMQSLQEVSNILSAQMRSGKGNTADYLCPPVISIDVEWRPYKFGKIANKCSLLQLRHHHTVFLFDLMFLEPEWTQSKDCEDNDLSSNKLIYELYSQLICSVLSSDFFLKVGYNLHNDIDRLRESFPAQNHYNTIVNIFDLCTLDDVNQSKGLSALCFKYTSKWINKDMQCSDWQMRPLSSQQISYAVIDAYVLLEIWNAYKMF